MLPLLHGNPSHCSAPTWVPLEYMPGLALWLLGPGRPPLDIGRLAHFLSQSLWNIGFVTLPMQLLPRCFGCMKPDKSPFGFDFVWVEMRCCCCCLSALWCCGTCLIKADTRALFPSGHRKHLRWRDRSCWPAIRRNGSGPYRLTTPKRSGSGQWGRRKGCQWWCIESGVTPDEAEFASFLCLGEDCCSPTSWLRRPGQQQGLWMAPSCGGGGQYHVCSPLWFHWSCHTLLCFRGISPSLGYLWPKKLS